MTKYVRMTDRPVVNAGSAIIICVLCRNSIPTKTELYTYRTPNSAESQASGYRPRVEVCYQCGRGTEYLELVNIDGMTYARPVKPHELELLQPVATELKVEYDSRTIAIDTVPTIQQGITLRVDRNNHITVWAPVTRDEKNNKVEDLQELKNLCGMMLDLVEKLIDGE